MGKLITTIFFIFYLSGLSAQEFYVNDRNIITPLYKPIQSNWSNININEANIFLNKSGFSKIKIEAAGVKEYVMGSFSNENYLLNRILVFEDKLIVGYIDKIKFITSCLVCFDNDLMKRTAGNPVMESLMGKQRSLNIQKDKELKESVFNKFYKLCENEGLRDMTGDMSSDLYDVTISGANNNYKISRSIKVELDKKFYDFTLSKIVLLEEDSYTVGAYDLKDVSTYDLAKMIDVFLVDCKLNGIKLQNNVIDVKFESLDDNTIGLSYAMNNDKLIKIRIDPQAWSESSTPKKWYLLYHELGHDVLNLEHGNGGKMMFNFADKGYSWSEFWEDKNYMINNYSK